MKSYYKILVGMAALAAGITLGGCQNDVDAPEMVTPVATMQANTTISELKNASAIWNEVESQDSNNGAVLCPYKDESSKTPYIIKGRVISSDASGNVYKSLYIQDETGAITFSINQSDMNSAYHIGQEVVVNVTGLYIGKYAGLKQVGWLSYYNSTPQVAFMGYELFKEHSELNGLPSSDMAYVNYGDAYPSETLYTVRTDIPTLTAMSGNTAKATEMMSQLIELDNVHFEGAGELTYATEDESVSRNLLDENGNSIIVRTSGYSDFWNYPLPEGNGKVRGLLSYYNGSWQVVIRSTADCIFKAEGTKAHPYTVEQAIAMQDEGESGWVNGYVVGSLKGGVSNVSGNDDVIWSADADMDNTIVLGPDPDCKDVAKCLVMQLPQGSELRKLVNLIDNPQMYKKPLKVRGAFETYLGTNGLTGNKGTVKEFEIEGQTAPDAAGEGTKDKPYNITAVMQSQETLTGVWVEGYVAGFVAKGNFNDENCVFAPTYEGSSSNFRRSTNIILSSVVNPFFSTDNSVPAELPDAVRPDLGLKDNPGLFGKKIKVKCDVGTYLGVRGLLNVTEFVK